MLPGDTHSSAASMNDRGQIVGWSGQGSVNARAALWEGDTITGLGDLPGIQGAERKISTRWGKLGWSCSATARSALCYGRTVDAVHKNTGDAQGANVLRLAKPPHAGERGRSRQ